MIRRSPIEGSPSRVSTLLAWLLLGSFAPALAQAPPAATDANAPLHLLKPDYPVPYGPSSVEKIAEVLERVRAYLDTATPARLIDGRTGREVEDGAALPDEVAIAPGAFRLMTTNGG